jgi:hypothetical protein
MIILFKTILIFLFAAICLIAAISWTFNLNFWIVFGVVYAVSIVSLLALVQYEENAAFRR